MIRTFVGLIPSDWKYCLDYFSAGDHMRIYIEVTAILKE